MTEPSGAETHLQPTGAPPPVSASQSTGAHAPVPPQPGSGTPTTVAQGAVPPSTGRWTGLAAALAVGLVLGGGIGAGTVAALDDPTDSDEYQALAAELEGARGQDADAGQASAAPSTSASSSTGAADDEPRLAQVGDTVSNQGVTLTVTNAFIADTIELNETSYAPGSGYEEYTHTPPDAGGKFVVVQTHVVNNAQVSMDLTCGYPVATTVVDAQDRQFDTVDSLYKLRDNPECNDQLQPGFEADMTYVYMVPASAQVVAFGFADATDFSDPSANYTGVQLDL